MTDDAKLIHALKRQSADAWTVFYRSRQVTVWRFVRGRVTCRQTADDITAEVFMYALRNIDQFNPSLASIDRWLFGIVRNTVAAHLRKYYREQNRLTFTGDPTSYENVDHSCQTNDDVSHILKQMSTVEREVLIWMYQENVSVREIACRLNRTEKAVENLLYRAREHFKKRFEAHIQKNESPHGTQLSQAIEKSAAGRT
ncbi:MAG: RNA polymerase sigma factor [Phycisphaeraceae bacterium JB051]